MSPGMTRLPTPRACADTSTSCWTMTASVKIISGGTPSSPPAAPTRAIGPAGSSAAAPTAGLHFTPELLEEIKAKGVNIAHVTLHVGLGTFRPVKVEDVTKHHMHSEFYVVEEDQAALINETKKKGGKIISVGTTSLRTLESASSEDGTLKAGSGWTDIFIYPGYRFKIVDRLITNFHLPESTLIMLVSALAGKEHIMAAYEEAVKDKYRFFSFGDAMFITEGIE